MPNKIEQTFTDAEVGELIAALLALPPGQRTGKFIKSWAADRGLRISIPSALAFRDKNFEQALDDLERKRRMAESITSVADAGKGLSDAGMALAAKRRFEQLMSGEPLDDDTLSTIFLDLSRAQAGDQRAKKLEADLKLRDEQVASLQREKADWEKKRADATAALAAAEKKGGITPDTRRLIEAAMKGEAVT